jgi:iron complex outermembrane receptor protein
LVQAPCERLEVEGEGDVNPEFASRKRVLLGCGAAALSVLTPLAAWAESAPVTADRHAAGAPQARAVQEIVVTAQRRAERLQDVPLSVTAVTADSLQHAGVTSTRDLELVTPGLRIEASGAYVQPVIRGITTTLTNIQEANIATYIDGVYQSQLLSAFYDLPDVTQVEVLKGPQGTLFGRNATGGAILIHTRDPDLNRPTGLLSAGYGRFGTTTLKGFVSMPIIEDKLAVSLTGYYNKSDGYERNLLRGGARKGAGVRDELIRGKVRFKPWDGADFVASAYYSHRRDFNALAFTNLNGNNAQAQWAAQNNQPIASAPWTFAFDVPSPIFSTKKGASLRGEIEAGPGTITTTTAFDYLHYYLDVDADNSPRPTGIDSVNSTAKAFSQEVVYATHQIGRFHGVAGLFYYDSDARMKPFDAIDYGSGFIFAEFWTGKVKAVAGFGELTYDLTDQLSITGGLRYSHERRQSNAGIQIGSLTPPPLPLLGAKSWNSVTPRVSVLYKMAHDTNLYFTYSQGFKSGTFNDPAMQKIPVNPEKVSAYEGGFKSTIAPNIRINGAAFYYDYTNLQVPTVSQQGVLLIQLLTNAATATIYGAELNGEWDVTDAFGLSFGATWLHARYDHFPNTTDNIPTGVGGNKTTLIDASGHKMMRSPTFSGNLTAHYRWDTTSLGNFELSGNLYYSSTINYDLISRVQQRPYATLNAALAWRTPVEGVEVRVWGRNLSNKAYFNSVGVTQNYDSVVYAPPRSYGVELNYSF